MKKNRVLFFHPMIRSYRLATWKELNNLFPGTIHYFFTNAATINDPDYLLPAVKKEVDDCLEDFNSPYTICREYRTPLTPNNLTLDIILPILNPETKLVIFSSITSIPTLLFFPLVKFLGKKAVLFDENWHYQNSVAFYRRIKPYIKLIARNMDAIISAGSASKKMFVDEFKVASKKVFVGLNSCEDSKSLSNEGSDLKKSDFVHGHNKRLLFLYLGRLVEYKGLDLLLRAIEQLGEYDSFSLLVVGDGPFKAFCQELVRNRGLKNVLFHPSVPLHKVGDFYDICDLFILPSRFKEEDSVNCESWGFVVNEVMARGKPVLTTTAVGAAYDLIIDGETGFLVKEGDSHALAVKLKTILSCSEKLKEIGTKGRIYLQNIADPLKAGKQYYRALKFALTAKKGRK
ncbi:glycosyltransferase family 4 protein [Candidatus Riflebacteria bacterium]